jgi:hypothetical protein
LEGRGHLIPRLLFHFLWPRTASYPHSLTMKLDPTGLY